MTLFENIDLAKKFGDGKVGLVESQEASQLDKTNVALDVAKHLRESKPEESKPVQLNSLPLPN